jgi:GT2 family glycosyltransferase
VLVSAVVVNFNARDLLLACVESLERALAQVPGETEVVVVDNGSQDGSPSAVRARHPAVRVLELGRNRGFAAAANEGVRAARAEWLLLLNNDATIEPGAVTALLEAARGEPRVGSLAAQMRFARGGTINSAGFDLDRLGVACDRHIGRLPAAAEASAIDVFGACAGAALMRRAMLEDIGGFDGSFFAYLDDVDVAWRARMRGWTCRYVPTAVVHHHHSATGVHGSPAKYFHVGRNRVRLLAKHMPTTHLLRYGAAILAYDLAYVLVVAVTDRTLAPLHGRVRGIGEWRAYRALGADRRPVALAPIRGGRRALARRRAALAGTAVDGRYARRATTTSW